MKKVQSLLATILAGGLIFAVVLAMTWADSADEEITALVSQFYVATTNGDIAVIDDITSDGSDALAIGTDPTEVFIGHDAIVAWWHGIFDFLGSIGYPNGGLPTESGNLMVNHKDTIGWAADQGVWHFAGGDVPFRLTLVLRKENGEWKIVQQHFSIGVSNADLPL